MQLSIGFSPCPNDTFIFDALVHNKIDTEGLKFNPVLLDVEALNRSAFEGSLDITKLSYYAYKFVQNEYILLDSGSALGSHCGPIVIAKTVFEPQQLSTKIIAIPGKYTTANFLLNYYLHTLPDYKPQTGRHIAMVFSDIMPAVQKEKVEAGVIIHENRFTYMEYGLHKIIDLGDFWESNTGHPIPLGGIAAKRNLPREILQKLNRVLRRSVAFALDYPESSQEFVRMHAQETKPEVIAQHIHLYVNHYTVEIGEQGKNAVKYMMQITNNTDEQEIENIYFVSDLVN
ncbi:MAG: 1,4-dihydroxy-6-naphthoate synthase [Bacteroidia bacterium]|nr:1,4-dihydroxy-6-naphthoate synthase [Bacteroidia bacterium]